MESQQELISLVNFKADVEDAPVIDSPRSLEACRQQGIKPQDLVKLGKEQLKQKFHEEKFQIDAFFDKYYNHYEEKRKQKIDILKNVRDTLIEERETVNLNRSAGVLKIETTLTVSPPREVLRTPTQNHSANVSTVQPALANSIVEKERKLLAKLTHIQTREIQRLIDQETKTEELRLQNELKEKKAKERQEKFEQEVEAQRRLAQEKRAKQDQLKEEWEKKQEEEEKQRKQIMFLQEQEKIKREYQREIERKRQAEAKEMEKQKKIEELERQSKILTKEQEQKVDERKKLIEQSEEVRKMKFEQQELQRKKMVESLRKQHEIKIHLAKQRGEEALIKKRQEFEQQQREEEERKRRYERDQSQKQEKIKLESIKKSQELRRVLETNEHMIEKKKQDYYSKQEEVAQKKAETSKIREHEENQKRLKELEKEHKIKEVLERNEKLLNQRKNELIKQFNMTDMKVATVQKSMKFQLDIKKSMIQLKTSDRHENVERIQNVNEYKRQKLLEKLENDNDRIERMRKEQDAIVAMRQRIRRDMDFKKEQIIKDLQRKQKRQHSCADLRENPYSSLTDPFMVTSNTGMNFPNTKREYDVEAQSAQILVDAE